MKILRRKIIQIFFTLALFFLFTISNSAQAKNCLCANGKQIDDGKSEKFQMCYRSIDVVTETIDPQTKQVIISPTGREATFDFEPADKALAFEEWKCNNGILTRSDPQKNTCDNLNYSNLWPINYVGVTYTDTLPKKVNVKRFGLDICSIDEDLLKIAPNKNTVTIKSICLGYEQSLYPASGISSCDSKSFDCQMTNTQYKDKIQKDFRDCIKCYSIIDEKDRDNPIPIDKMSLILTQWTELGCLYKNINPETTTNANFYVSISRIFYGLALLFALIKIIMSGYTLMNSANMDQIKEAKNEIISIATAVLLFSSGIIVLSYVGIDVLGLDIKAYLPTFI